MKRKLSTAASRADLIASYQYAAAPLAPPAKTPPAPAEDGKPFEPVPYHADADETVLCPSCQKHNDDDASFCDQCGAKLAGNADVKVEPAGEKPEPAPAKPAVAAAGGPIVVRVSGEDLNQIHHVAVTAATVPPPPVPTKGGTVPNTNPVDENGNVDDGAVCTTPDCGHLGSSHANTGAGENTGSCAMQGCTCEGMTVDVDPNSDDDASGSGEADNSPGMTPVKTSGPAVADAPKPMAPETTEPPALNEPPPMPGGENMGPAFTIPVGIIEGQPTGDGRQIAAGALKWRTPPMPLMGLATETHDPEGFDQNDPAVMCGRIDSLERVPGEGDTQLIVCHGFYLSNDDGRYFADLNEQMGRLGISADVAVQSSEIQVGDIDLDGWPTDMSELLTEGTIMGFTVCPFPAFEGAYVVLGDGTETPDATAIPQQADGPIVPDKPPAAVLAGGQLLHLMSYEQCEPCDQGLELIVASGAGPSRPPQAWFSDPNFTDGDGRLVEILDRRGKRALGGKFACPITVTDQGRVFGHIAPWGVCHTGHTGQCILAPRSGADYAHFKRGQHLTTAEGDKIRVGVITADAGHANVRGINAASAMAHYDNTALAVADVNVGEDEYGIWVAGAIRPDATDDQIRKLTAASISGDWRQIGGQLELVAALAVNQPGFPLAVVAGGQQALVAAGATVMDRLKHPVMDENDPAQRAFRAMRNVEKLREFAASPSA